MLAVNAISLYVVFPESGDWSALEKIGKEESDAPCSDDGTHNPDRQTKCRRGEDTPVEEQYRQLDERERRNGHEFQGQ